MSYEEAMDHLKDQAERAEDSARPEAPAQQAELYEACYRHHGKIETAGRCSKFDEAAKVAQMWTTGFVRRMSDGLALIRCACGCLLDGSWVGRVHCAEAAKVLQEQPVGPLPTEPTPTPEELQRQLDSLGLEGLACLEAADELLGKHGYVYSGKICTCDDMGEHGHAPLCGYVLKSADEPVGPFPAEPAPGTPEAVAAAAETIRGLHTPERRWVLKKADTGTKVNVGTGWPVEFWVQELGAVDSQWVTEPDGSGPWREVAAVSYEEDGKLIAAAPGLAEDRERFRAVSEALAIELRETAAQRDELGEALKAQILNRFPYASLEDFAADCAKIKFEPDHPHLKAVAALKKAGLL